MKLSSETTAVRVSAQDRPRVFYRGTNPGDTRRIKTGGDFWDSLLFVADDPKKASYYGKHIETVEAKPEARILYEGSKEFRSVAKGLKKPMSLLEYCTIVAKRAQEAGYDAIWFRLQGDVGTAILNPSAFTRSGVESPMKLSVDSSRVAVYSPENRYLSQYMKEKPLDLEPHLHEFIHGMKTADVLERIGVTREEAEEILEDEEPERRWELAEKLSNALTREEKEEIGSYIGSEYPSESPAWAHMDLRVPRLPRNTWLVHFTGEAFKISEQGFTRGVEEINKVALTHWIHENEKKYGGYNFAFIAGNRDSIAAASKKGYGKHAVMFQGSGLEVYHYGDEERQVIFWGKAIDPRTIVELASDGSDWVVAPRQKSSMYQKDREYAYKGDFKDVVNWVERHWFQYRKQIMGK